LDPLKSKVDVVLALEKIIVDETAADGLTVILLIGPEHALKGKVIG
jgi:hypothetical protein